MPWLAMRDGDEQVGSNSVRQGPLSQQQALTVAEGYPKTAHVQVFGCRHDDAIHALRRPASEKRQGTKSREVGTGGAAGAMEI